MNIQQWIDTQLQSTSKELMDINFTDMRGVLVSGLGMKEKVYKLLDLLRIVMFPNIYKSADIDKKYLNMTVSTSLNESSLLLNTIIAEVFYNLCNDEIKDTDECSKCAQKAEDVTVEFMKTLPDIRRLLSTDIKAAYDGDPAAKSFEDVMLSYPCMEAITVYRLAHRLRVLDVPLIPRIMTEYAHMQTGIDINPGAKIGSHFFIDHGTGVVIGETCVIGNNVKLYQGVTLGAKSFETDENGKLMDFKRHPNIEDDVIIYSGATILGGETTVGKGSIIGGNVWLTRSVPPYSKVYNSTPSPYIKADENGDDEIK